MRSLFLPLLWSRYLLPKRVFSVGENKKKRKWLQTSTNNSKYKVCSHYSLHAGSFFPTSQMVNTSPRSEAKVSSVFLYNTVSSGSAFHALPSAQPQAPLALGGSSLHLDCPLRKHLNPMQEHIYAPQLSLQKVCRYLAQITYKMPFLIVKNPLQ